MKPRALLVLDHSSETIEGNGFMTLMGRFCEGHMLVPFAALGARTLADAKNRLPVGSTGTFEGEYLTGPDDGYENRIARIPVHVVATIDPERGSHLPIYLAATGPANYVE